MCFLTLWLASSALAWGGTGHQVVALIAEARLTGEAEAGVRELLGDARISDAEIVNWADELRRERRETAPWHFVDIPLEAHGFNSLRDGRDGDNVISALNRFEKVLANRKADKAQRVEALKFAIHLVGDVHQPLHCAERGHDRGGNGRLVFFLEQPRAVNLHTVWDSALLREAMAGTRVLEYADRLNREIVPADATTWEQGDVEQWADEAHVVAREHAYEAVPADGAPPKLGRQYVDRNLPVVERQLQRAGVRLALVLNRAFDRNHLQK